MLCPGNTIHACGCSAEGGKQNASQTRVILLFQIPHELKEPLIE